MRHEVAQLQTRVEDKRMSGSELPTRKVFNCIVDDTALIAGVKKSTRDGIRKWIAAGAIHLFVPLHALTQLDRLKKGSDRISADAREAVKWLDQATSDRPAAERVHLQGPLETFQTWEEVENFALPETLFSESGAGFSDSLAEDVHDKLSINGNTNRLSMSSTGSVNTRSPTPSSPASTRSSIGPVPEPVSPVKITASVHSATSGRRSHSIFHENGKNPLDESTSPSGVPLSLQPLINYVLWRIHQESDATAALESFILLTNDLYKQAIAQRFGIRVKLLEQLRDVVAREEREYHNRVLVFRRELQAEHDRFDEDEDDEDEVVLKRPGKTWTPSTKPSEHRVMDPNDFARAPQTPRNGTVRGRGGLRGSPKGVAAPVTVRSGLGNPNGPIDPNSFARPPPRSVRGRGGNRLWQPT
ncbi:hypothetical protein BJ546DRAFT_1027952 [Cryomyces antarcticus]